MNIIRKSGQGWKVVLVAIAWVPWILVLAVLGNPANSGLATSIALVLAIVGSILGARSIRCPGCRARWLWLAASEQDHRIWLTWFAGLRTCPKCGWE